jgi:hypothetical protein
VRHMWNGFVRSYKGIPAVKPLKALIHRLLSDSTWLLLETFLPFVNTRFRFSQLLSEVCIEKTPLRGLDFIKNLSHIKYHEEGSLSLDEIQSDI